MGFRVERVCGGGRVCVCVSVCLSVPGGMRSATLGLSELTAAHRRAEPPFLSRS